jgi:citrate synthase
VTSPEFSEGLEGIIAGETAISTIQGGLRYRGYAVEDLATHASFEETAWLILNGDLPTAGQLADFKGRLAHGGIIPPLVMEVLSKLPTDVPLMDVMRSATSLLGHFDPDAQDNSPAADLRKTERLLAQLPVVMAATHRFRTGRSPVRPDPKRSIAENVLWMLHGQSPPESWVRAMDVSLVLYAEHEFNASTFTSRVVSSTLSDLHSAIAAAVGALKGPLHGGANEKVMEVLAQVGTADRALDWIRQALARKVRIMGFGHRVYKTGDPRARFLKPWCDRLARETGHEDMEAMADVIESVVTGEKKLPPNLDWPSARLYHYMNLDVPLYTPLFVISRVAGWSAHVAEQHANNRLIRPLANYTGRPPRPWIPLAERG